MATIFVDDIQVDIGTQKLNCVQAADIAGIEIPHYCYHPALSVVASCRMCLVEVGELKDGKVIMQPKVLPGCQTPVKDGTVVVTGKYELRHTPHSRLPYDASYTPGDRAKKAQADSLEGLLLNHPLDCPVCDKAGECKLQDYSYEYGRSESRMIDIKNTPPNKPDLSSKITLFTDRCIMCSRCVRFCREIAGTAELTITNRGSHSEIDIFPGLPLENKLAGNVVDLCPVGALGSKDFLYSQRVWYLKSHEGVCSLCSTGCSIYSDVSKDIVYRVRARENVKSQGHFICDDGRYGFHFVQDPRRIQLPLSSTAPVGHAASPISLPTLGVRFKDVIGAGPAVLALSPFLTLEEAYLFCNAFRRLSGSIKFVLGPVPMIGSDDIYPKAPDLNGDITPKFIVRSEKCPNRLGLELILRHFEGDIRYYNPNDAVNALFFVGGYPDPSFVDSVIGENWTRPELLVVQELFPNRMTSLADIVLPATSSYEKEGTFVNFSGLAQTFPRAITPSASVRPELQVAHEIAGRTGLVRASDVRREMASVISSLAFLNDHQSSSSGTRIELQIAR